MDLEELIQLIEEKYLRAPDSYDADYLVALAMAHLARQAPHLH